MTRPDWRTSRAGARVRVALWLLAEVGAGGTFTKSQLRHAFPAVEQVDRRMRDLRAEGWVITTYREDRSLSPDELRLVQVGGNVWERGYRSRVGSTMTDKERHAVFASDNFACVFCGISGGETYSDDALRTAKLTVARVTSPQADEVQWSTCCDRCHVAVRDGSPSEIDLQAAVNDLDEEQRQRLREWILRDTRTRSSEEIIWAEYRRAPRAKRILMAEQLGLSEGEQT